jgi:DNA-binding transcriptional LysR family regulator
VTVAPSLARLHRCQSGLLFAAYHDMAVEMAASESPTTIIEEGFDLAICSGDPPDSTLVAKIHSDDDRSHRHSQHHTLRCTGIGPTNSAAFEL